ncbi:hypothetical protein ABT010_28475 [Streptomyces sp. NPDC002668]|uniref:hypothetical protein n=1 Tax=Streptomyces sp. NPDC002668 TaxID=3154422 RepID=UPI00331971A1
MPWPLLLVRARRPQPPMPGREGSGELLEAYSKGLADQELTRLADGHPTATLQDIDATQPRCPRSRRRWPCGAPVPGPVG